MPAGLYHDGFEYYGKTHYPPNSTPRYTTSSLLDLMTFDATDQAMQKATGTADKKEVIIEGASHIETYWKPEYVSQISDQLTQFFKTKL
ncbi:hypothetical protein [Avibacterium paragallinarum]|uniref:hypothetical protein n=1 Tax=Avibacterium paragallinarum TaxID=728 RepID=UPI00397C3696